MNIKTNEIIRLQKKYNDMLNDVVINKRDALGNAIKLATDSMAMNLRTDGLKEQGITHAFTVQINDLEYRINIGQDEDLIFKIKDIHRRNSLDSWNAVTYEACKFIYKLQKELDKINNNNESEE